MNYLQYHEKAMRGKFNFPVQLYCVSQTHPRYEMPFHWHTECELILVRRGFFGLILDGVKKPLRAGESAFVHGGCLHGGSPSACEYDCLVFDMEKILHDSVVGKEQYTQILNGSLVLKSPFSAESTVGKIVASIMSAMRRQETGYEFTTVGLLWQFFGAALRGRLCAPQVHSEKSLAHQSLRMKNVLRKIRMDYDRPINLSDLAAEAGLVPQYFCRAFKKASGKTPIEYLNFYRIECAAELLISSSIDVTNVALQCGFNDISYFIRLFSKYKGMTPKVYRRVLASLSSK